MWKLDINLVIRLARWMAPTRAHQAAWLVVNLSAAILAFVPLFNLVGYESAAFYGVMLGVLATGLTVFAVRTGAMEAPLSSARRENPTVDFGRLAIRHIALGLGPLFIITLNGLRVPTCDWGAGFAFWGLIPLGAILLGQTAGWVAVSVAPKGRFLPWILAFSFPAIDAVGLVYHLASQPPIIGHQWFMGYFGGSIYDEALAVPSSLIAYRVLHLLAIIAVLAAVEATFAFRQKRWAGWTMALSLGAAVAFGVGFSQRADMGVGIDRAYIVETLGGKVETEHFIIYYPATEQNAARLDEMIEDHEFRYHQLRLFFGTDPVAESGRKVRSFVYANRETKGRLMGGRDTMVAKIWLHEMHIIWRGVGDHMLAHELAHIFTEPFGAGPLRLSMQRGIGVNMGLVEGIAAAAEWPSQELTPHESSAAMRQLGIAPDLGRILGAGGFWTQASGRAYTAVGSFVRYLIDREGMETFQLAYPRGDFQGAYGVGVEELISDWEEFVDQIELTERQREVARYRFDRPSIFGKFCARSRAETRRLARAAASRGDLLAAQGHYVELLEEDAIDQLAVREYAVVLGRLDLPDEALEMLNSVPRELLSRVQRARFLELEGDLRWQSDDHAGASAVYSEALELGVPLDTERSLLVKNILAGRHEYRGRRYLVDNPSVVGAMHMLMRWRQEKSEDPVVAYLLGRRLWQTRKYVEAIPYLEEVAGALTWEVLDAEASLMLGHSYYFAGRLDDSQGVWEGLADSEITRYREAARVWLLRVEWAGRNRE